MIRVILPQHLRTLARVGSEVEVELGGPATVRAVLDALEANHPVLRGTIRDHATQQRRPFVRFFACEEDLSHRSAGHAAARGRCQRDRAVAGGRGDGRAGSRGQVRAGVGAVWSQHTAGQRLCPMHITPAGRVARSVRSLAAFACCACGGSAVRLRRAAGRSACSTGRWMSARRRSRGAPSTTPSRRSTALGGRREHVGPARRVPVRLEADDRRLHPPGAGGVPRAREWTRTARPAGSCGHARRPIPPTSMASCTATA